MSSSTLMLRKSVHRVLRNSNQDMLRWGAKLSKRWQSTTSTAAASISHVEPPTARQLRQHFAQCAVPMIGFGLMDQTVMLQAGNAIDCTIGVTFGLSTLTAAALGQICSDAAGVVSGGTLERVGTYMGLSQPHFSHAQRSLPIVRHVGLWGQLLGVILGCTLGLVNLIWMDTERSSTLKLRALAEEHEFAFEVEASNVLRDDATVLTVRGPDVDGLLASLTATLTAQGCSLMELHAGKAQNENGQHSNTIEDTFVIVGQDHTQIPDDELDDLASALLEATVHPINVQSFRTQKENLEEQNLALQSRIAKLEQILQERQITVVPRLQTGALLATSLSPTTTPASQENE